MTPPYVVHIGWGDRPDEYQQSMAYRFATQAERDAFRYALSEADGWLGNRELPRPSVFLNGRWVDDLEPACPQEYCESCNEPLDAGFIGLCEPCQPDDEN